MIAEEGRGFVDLKSRMRYLLRHDSIADHSC